MKIKTWMLGASIAIILLGGIAASSAAGLWKTTNSGNGGRQEAGAPQGQTAGQADPAAIRGSMTFGEISEDYGVPLEDLGGAFEIGDPAAYDSFQCKELESVYGGLGGDIEIGVASVRYFVALYTGDTAASESAAWLPRAAAEILEAKAGLTEEQRSTLAQFTADVR